MHWISDIALALFRRTSSGLYLFEAIHVAVLKGPTTLEVVIWTVIMKTLLMKLSYFSEAVYIVNIVFHCNCSKVIHDLCIKFAALAEK